MTTSAAPPRTIDRFDEEFDVVVVGYGFAGGVAAISAHDHGAKVLLVEKMPDPGGISICAGGGLRLSTDREAALAYITATNDGTTPGDVIEALVDGMLDMEEFVRRLARTDDAKVVRVTRKGNYPFPGFEAMYFLEVESVPGFDAAVSYPHAQALRNGPKLFKVVDDNVRACRIDVRMSTPAIRLITDDKGEVQGIWVREQGRLRAIKARRGVILCCGGFEAAPAIQRDHWQLGPVMSAAFGGNTGDGIRMAVDAGAELWHMWHFHGSYGFKSADGSFPFGIRVKRLPDWVPPEAEASVPMSWILVDREGRRFANEYDPYMQDTGHRPLDVVDPLEMRRPYVPCFLLVDDDGRRLYPLGSVVFNDRSVARWTWSADNMAEVQNGLLKRAESVAEAAALVGCEPAVLQATLDRWNEACARQADTDFRRPGKTMVPVRKPPFLIGEIWPVVSNTQGGPRHDPLQRVLNSYGEPIGRLYEAGEIGSVWGYLYLSGGNLTECFVGGRIAGQEAARALPWDVSQAARVVAR